MTHTKPNIVANKLLVQDSFQFGLSDMIVGKHQSTSLEKSIKIIETDFHVHEVNLVLSIIIPQALLGSFKIVQAIVI